jgi:hypothetical protein
MGEVVFRCPNTAADFESGFQAEPNELISLPANTTISIWCPSCGGRHDIKLSEGKIADKLRRPRSKHRHQSQPR